MFTSIRWRITVLYVALISLLIIIGGGYGIRVVRQKYTVDLELLLNSQAELIAESFEINSGARNENEQAHLAELADVYAKKFDAQIIFVDAGLVAIATSDSGLVTLNDMPLMIDRVLGSESQELSGKVLDDLLIAIIEIEEDDGDVAYVIMLASLDRVNEVTSSLRLGLGLFVVLSGVLATMMAFLIARRTVEPLAQLTRAVRYTELNEPDLIDWEIRAQDETGQLAGAVQSLVVHLQIQIDDLKNEQNKLMGVFGQLRDGVLIANESGRIVLINPAAEQLFSIAAENAAGHSASQILHRHQFIDLWQAFQVNREEATCTVEIPQQNYYVQMTVMPFSIEGQEKHALLLFQDLAQIRHLETVRRDFVSNVSHELRTPLASLKALAETLQDGALNDPPAARHFLSRINEEVDALSQMVSELLELSRIESGQVPLQIAATAPQGLAQASINRLSEQAKRAGVQLQIDVPDSLPEIWVDALRMEQVFVNLIHNAIKFTDPGGRISIKGIAEENRVCFTVQDTGVGIRREDLGRIFERFYKADQARSSGGTGLGLSIARHMVEAHAGEIWVESIEGRGSTFFVCLPVAVN